MLEQIKKLREMTGAGVVDTKKALDEAEGDEQKALEILKAKGLQKAEKKSDREAGEGLVFSYLHSNGKVGSILKLHCESDFVARNEEFQALGRDIAMHIAAMDPKGLNPEDMGGALIAAEREAWKEELSGSGKSGDELEAALASKEAEYRDEKALLKQPFVKDPSLTIAELVASKIAKIGENIRIGEFARLEM